MHLWISAWAQISCMKQDGNVLLTKPCCFFLFFSLFTTKYSGFTVEKNLVRVPQPVVHQENDDIPGATTPGIFLKHWQQVLILIEDRNFQPRAWD